MMKLKVVTKFIYSQMLHWNTYWRWHPVAPGRFFLLQCYFCRL